MQKLAESIPTAVNPTRLPCTSTKASSRFASIQKLTILRLCRFNGLAKNIHNKKGGA
ncbi:MAG: hypothetical protein HOO86_13615 [Bacteroidales bacterium]|nr:hypothetical protein [Bacteroidales bacterium]